VTRRGVLWLGLQRDALCYNEAGGQPWECVDAL